MGKIKKHIFITIFYLATLSCGTNNFNAKYTAMDFNNPDKQIHIKLNLPEGFKVIKKVFDHSIEYRYVYSDSSIFFVSNNKVSGSRINRFNRLNAGIDILYKEHENDSLFFTGVNQNKFWKEYILDNVVVGYIVISKDRKAEFDKALLSLWKKGVKGNSMLRHELLHHGNQN